jgi:uncharacterized protein
MTPEPSTESAARLRLYGHNGHMTVTVTEITRYPVKSCRGEPMAMAVVEPWGLAGDRRWMAVDAHGRPLTAREIPRMVLVTPSLASPSLVPSSLTHGGGSATIALTFPGAPDLTVAVSPGTDLVPVEVWGSKLQATHAGDAAADWFTAILGVPARLVYLDDPTRRQVDPKWSKDSDRVSFADAYPLLLTSEDSLAALNTLIAAGRHAAEGPLPITRFRPNVVVAGAAAWAEDKWQRLLIGDVSFRVAKGCDRCVFTTIDPDTAIKGKEPLVTLARHRRREGKIWFGVNLIPDDPGSAAVIRVGDPVVTC